MFGIPNIACAGLCNVPAVQTPFMGFVGLIYFHSSPSLEWDNIALALGKAVRNAASLPRQSLFFG
jgi:hypothetical protein